LGARADRGEGGRERQARQRSLLHRHVTFKDPMGPRIRIDGVTSEWISTRELGYESESA
jgi:hypothetical protein